MYYYIIEKELNTKYTMADIQSLNELMTNNDSVHHLLSKLFNVDKEENWRSRYNILYKADTETTFKLKIQSDKKINDEVLSKMGFKIISENKINIKNNDKLHIKLDISPFRKDKSDNKKRVIGTLDERVAWLKNKLSHNNECNIINISEISQIMNFMQHNDISKGSCMLRGYRYELDVSVNDKEAFTEIVRKGIGPQKNYGFGLIEIA